MDITKFKRGQVVEYTREIMFKGSETVKATIVAVLQDRILLDNGDEFKSVKLKT